MRGRVGIILGLLVGYLAFSSWRLAVNNQETITKKQTNSTFQEPNSSQDSKFIQTATPTSEPVRDVLLDVPFGAQAPFGEWSDPRQQDGCEEAATILAYCGNSKSQCPISEGKIEKAWMKQKIIAMYDFQVAKWGSGVDTSAEDTGKRLLKGYFNLEYRVSSVETYESIVRELMAGHIVIVPTNGKKLGNPNFSHGGPDRHMVVIRGYEAQAQQFITQDPGTRQGENYRYNQDVLFEAIRDYPTGNHAPVIYIHKFIIAVDALQ